MREDKADLRSGRRRPLPGRVPTRPDGARTDAARLVRAVIEEGAALDDARLPADREPAERARALRLARSVLRHMTRIDAVLGSCLDRTPPAPVRALLRVSVAEMMAEGAPPHAVVNATVATLRKDRRHHRQAAMANAVLRRIASAGQAVWDAAGPPRLPDWIADPLRAAHGPEVLRAIETAHEGGAMLDITPRLGEEAATLARLLDAEPLPGGSLRRRAMAQVSALPGYAEGRWWVQDAAAAVPARALGPVAAQRVLDLCAAPGGKTLQLAAAGARVTALDISAARLARLEQNLARTGLSAEIVVADALAWEPPAQFDAILLDAPCSATGTIRRHPDLPHRRDGGDVAGLAALQAALLRRAAAWLTPGGRLVYATCSLLPAEGEDQIAALCESHSGLRLAALTPADFGLPDTAATASGALRLRPDFWEERGGMDGFFIARLDADAAAPLDFGG